MMQHIVSYLARSADLPSALYCKLSMYMCTLLLYKLSIWVIITFVFCFSDGVESWFQVQYISVADKVQMWVRLGEHMGPSHHLQKYWTTFGLFFNLMDIYCWKLFRSLAK